MEVVAEAANGSEAIDACHTHRPDVVLMDLRMPMVDGIAATGRITAEHDNVKVLVLTTFDGDRHVYDAVVTGASGFMLKDATPAELAHAVRTVAAGDTLLAGRITRRLLEQFTAGPPPGEVRTELVRGLTDRELDVLRAVATGQSNDEIATKLYLSPATVKTHLARIFAKLHLRDRAQAVVLAYEAGLVRVGDNQSAEQDGQPGG
jgi:DNA-binding NarL/FixJ family response regulator